MTSAKSVANAVGGKTARACDSCITKRARWYCAADDAFLCQACDSSVHSANSLARRHERVRLKTASFRSNTDAASASDELLNRGPTWHHGFTKKARTPRHGKQHYSASTRTRNPFHLVPEVGYLDEANSNSHEENEEQLLYRVPIFEPFVAELCSTPSSVTSNELGGGAVVENKRSETESLQLMQGLLPSDIELAEFAADVESLLGRGLENECIGMEELGLIDHTDNKHEGECCVKVEEEEEAEAVVASKDQVVEMGKESSFELNFDYETCELEGKKEKVGLGLGMENDVGKEEKENDSNNNGGKRKISLQLDYEAVIIAWASQKCPWTTGDKPNLDPDDEAWPHCMGTCGTQLHYPYGGFGCHPAMADGGREARVSRYREKRRTRLFSKKIRYEVRKLNAEKRPRMKGRFVKRASFAAPTFPLLNK